MENFNNEILEKLALWQARNPQYIIYSGCAFSKSEDDCQDFIFEFHYLPSLYDVVARIIEFHVESGKISSVKFHTDKLEWESVDYSVWLEGLN